MNDHADLHYTHTSYLERKEISSHLILGLPIPIFPCDLVSNFPLLVQVLSIIMTCPALCSLLILIHSYLARCGYSYNFYNSKLNLLPHWPFSCTVRKHSQGPPFK